MSRDFALFLVSRFASAAATSLLRAAIGWHVFHLSHSAFFLGLIGLVQFAPVLGLTLVGGAVADSHDRRRVINVAQLVVLATGVVLFLATRTDEVSLPVLFGGVVAAATAFAFEAPARAALLPALVPRERFARAVTISSTNQALAFAAGPAIGGLVIASAGIAAAYAVHAGLTVVAFVCVAALRGGGGVARARAVNLRAIREGLAFVWRQPVILGCMSLDMFAVIFGGATALLPIYATEILHAGPRGYGLLTSALEIGALSMSIVMMLRAPARAAGQALLGAVLVFGAATIVFGLSRSFPLSFAAYMVAGMADQISVVMRATAVQLSTPDELRGRVSAVNLVFIGASNHLGAAESGFVAHLTDPTFSVVSGGVACLLVVALVAWRVPALRQYRFS